VYHKVVVSAHSVAFELNYVYLHVHQKLRFKNLIVSSTMHC